MTTAATLRSAIARCASQASEDAPASCDLRLAVFVARLSGCMESLGDHELDAMLWGLFDHDRPAPPRDTSIPQLTILGAA